MIWLVILSSWRSRLIYNKIDKFKFYSLLLLKINKKLGYLRLARHQVCEQEWQGCQCRTQVPLLCGRRGLASKLATLLEDGRLACFPPVEKKTRHKKNSRPSLIMFD